MVALSDAWQKGAQQWPAAKRVAFANDPLNLLAVDADTNRSKGDGDAATWLPPNKPFRCAYVARQVAVKRKYKLAVTAAEESAIARVLAKCPGQKLPTASASGGRRPDQRPGSAAPTGRSLRQLHGGARRRRHADPARHPRVRRQPATGSRPRRRRLRVLSPSRSRKPLPMPRVTVRAT